MSVTLEIDERVIAVREGASVLEAAAALNIAIPTLCHLPGHASRPVCRMCVVEIEGRHGLHPACATVAEHGMIVTTNSPEIGQLRRTLMTLVMAEHGQCDNPDCAIDRLAAQLGVLDEYDESEPVEVNGNPDGYVSVDVSRCIHCDRCIRACEQVIITRAGRGAGVGMAFGDDQQIEDTPCSLCGDCLAACPSGALGRHRAGE